MVVLTVRYSILKLHINEIKYNNLNNFFFNLKIEEFGIINR